MSDNLSSIRKILAKNNYEVVLEFSTLEESKIKLTIPASKILPAYESFIVCYMPCEKGEVEGLAYLANGSEREEFIKCPKYSFRTLISVDVKKVCQQIDYDFSIISFIVDGNQVTEEELFNKALNFELDELELEKEKCLNYILESFELDDSTPDISEYASKDYLDEVYDVVRAFYGIDK